MSKSSGGGGGTGTQLWLTWEGGKTGQKTVNFSKFTVLAKSTGKRLLD